MRFRVPLCLILCLWSLPARGTDESVQGIAVTEGFRVTRFADDALAHDIHSLTIDAQGRVVVSGPGFVKILLDQDGDGVAERFKLFSSKPSSGAQGMCFLGSDLIFTGDGVLGRIRDLDADGSADVPPQTLAEMRTSEHGAHAVLQGPDGWLYVLCGNDAGVSANSVQQPTSPITNPSCGCLVRVRPDGTGMEVLAHGFRNPYDMAITADGRILTVDSDGERAHHLPWYAPTRLFDVAPGMHHGWLERGWQQNFSRPESFFDNVPRLAELGRGSPTGLIIYRHRQFPERYRGGVFTACWTLGRIYYCPLERSGSTFDRSNPETFLQTTGSAGFAPVDMAIGPRGEMYVAIGGRGTSGGVFRIEYEVPTASASSGKEPEPLTLVLNAAEPLSAWSRARWVPLARTLGKNAFLETLADKDLPIAWRVRAIEVLVECFGGVPLLNAKAALANADAELAARIAWALSTSEGDQPAAQRVLASLTYWNDPLVRRAAWEGLAHTSHLADNLSPTPNWLGEMDGSDRRARAAMLTVANGPGKESYRGAIAAADWVNATVRMRFSRIWASSSGELSADPGETNRRFAECLELLDQIHDSATALECVRLLQLCLGDIRSDGGPEELVGYSGRATDQIGPLQRQVAAARLAQFFPTNDADVNRELARTLAMLRTSVPGLFAKLATRWTDESNPADDVHYLIATACLAGDRTPGFTTRLARAFVTLHKKLDAGGMFTSRTWPDWVGHAFKLHLRHDPSLARALIADPEFGRSEHCLFASHMDGSARRIAATRLLAHARDASNRLSADEPASGIWTEELLAILRELEDEELFGPLRDQWDKGTACDEIVKLLARNASPLDRGRFLTSLDSQRADVAQRAARALAELDLKASTDEKCRGLRTLARWTAMAQTVASADREKSLERRQLSQQSNEVIESLDRLLRRWTSRIDSTESPELATALEDWITWFGAHDPEVVAAFKQPTAGNTIDWQTRLTGVAWDSGDVAHGRALFERLACHRCHAGAARLGPDLSGVTARLSREDLFTAIVEPNRDISPLYSTTLIATRAGQVYHGMLVYDSPEGILLQTGADTTVRLTGDEILERQTGRQSIMPTGLLNDVDDQGLADLYEYLRTLAAP